MSGQSTKTLVDRKFDLVNDFKLIEGIISHISLVPAIMIQYDRERLELLYRKYLDMGYEGIMVKDSLSVYESRRSSAWCKLKPMDTYDLTIIGFEEGTGKFSGMLGAFIVDFNSQEVHVGTGYTEQERIEFWKNRQEMIGKVIEVRAQEETTNKDGTHSLRFPAFVRVRLDK